MPNDAPPEKRLIVGCGYLGRRVAAHWLAAGHVVSALTRSTAKAGSLAGESITPILADIANLETIPELPAFDSVLFAVGFDRSPGQSIGEIYVDGLSHLLSRMAMRPPRRFVYISSTGVYGVTTGEKIDEETPAEPLREGGKACLAAENLLSAAPWRDRTMILRLAGLYGPGRLPRKEYLLAGKSIAAPETGWLNLIHVEDAAQAVDLALEKAAPPRTYLVADGAPVQRGDYYREAARQLGAPPPTFAPDAASSKADRAGSDKQVCNARLIRELGFMPQFPSYREGIAASLPRD